MHFCTMKNLHLTHLNMELFETPQPPKAQKELLQTQIRKELFELWQNKQSRQEQKYQ